MTLIMSSTSASAAPQPASYWHSQEDLPYFFEDRPPVDLRAQVTLGHGDGLDAVAYKGRKGSGQAARQTSRQESAAALALEDNCWLPRQVDVEAHVLRAELAGLASRRSRAQRAIVVDIETASESCCVHLEVVDILGSDETHVLNHLLHHLSRVLNGGEGTWLGHLARSTCKSERDEAEKEDC